jgi:serine protease Do
MKLKTFISTHAKTALIASVFGMIGAGTLYALLPKSDYYIQGNTTGWQHQQASYPGPAPVTTAPIAANVDFIKASAISSQSVVYITTMEAQAGGNNWFDWYFGGGNTNQAISSGSGVIFTDDGYIITNNHVVEGADKIEVMHGKHTYSATLVGHDPSSDLAVIHIDGESLPAIKPGNSSEVKVGEWVLAVGNPFNLTSTVTAGIVSAKGRNIHLLQSEFPIESFIQTDAAINPGNSGGALVNLKGELIGINTAIYSRTGSYTGYGFAVPVDIVKKIVQDLITYGQVQKAFFGADVSEINTAVAEEHNLQDLEGVLITSLIEDGAAARAGLKAEDVILKINGANVDARSAFDELMSYRSPGDKISLTYKRGTVLGTAELTLTNLDGTTEILKKTKVYSETLDASFEPIFKYEKARLGIDNGMRIADPGKGLIRKMGLPEGLIIASVNKVAINSVSDLETQLTGVRGRVIIEGIGQNGSRAVYSFYL